MPLSGEKKKVPREIQKHWRNQSCSNWPFWQFICWGLGRNEKKSSPEKISCPDFYLHSGWLALLKNDQYWLKNLWTMPSIRGTLLPSSITNWFPFKELVLSQTPIWKSNKILSICGSPLHNYSNPVGNMWLEERNCVSEFFLMLPKLYLFKLVIKIFLQHH